MSSTLSLPWIVATDEALPAGIEPATLLGGKGAGLLAMRQQLNLAVPPAFVITTEVCREYLTSGWPARLDALITQHLERLAEVTGRRFGDVHHPLLVSVRSGAPVSMPGMMDTVLNVGITPGARDRLAVEAAVPIFGADTWLRFVRMYAEIVLGLQKGEVGSAAESDASVEGRAAAAERVRKLASDLAPPGIPLDPRSQLRGAIEAVFRSWNSDRARVFRAREGVSDALGTAVTVQAMVFGNLDEHSGTGVAFTRDPATGTNAPFGDYLPRAQGEDVVAGTHAVAGLESLRERMPTVYQELLAVLGALELHYRDVCDVEFTVASGSLYILQTRVARRSPLAAVRIAIAMAEDPAFPLSRAEAVTRVDAETLQRASTATQIDGKAVPLAVGLPASPGIGTGVLSCDPDEAAALAQTGTPVVLAREYTSPSDVHGMVGAAAVVTTTGGVASHAAVVARGWGIPCATGMTKAVVSPSGVQIGAVTIRCGQLVTVDGSTGALYEGDCRAPETRVADEARILRTWASELGVEPGSGAPRNAAPSGDREVTLLEVLRTVQLKGLCSTERAAAALGVTVDSVANHITAANSLFRETARGFMVSPEGREWVEEGLQREGDGSDSRLLNAEYEQFSVLNARFKQLVHAWQDATAGGDDASHSALLDSLQSIHQELTRTLTTIASAAPRLATYEQRFESALAALRGGDHSMLASPLKDSYHTVWFEYHEELVRLCRRDRLAEERGGN